MITQQDIEARLEALRKKKPVRPKAYQDFMPETLGIERKDTSLYDSQLGTIEQRGRNETDIVQERAQNEREKLQLLRAQAEAKRARQAVLRAQKEVPVKLKPGSRQQNYGDYQGQRNFGKKWGPDNTPEVSDLKQINPNAPIVGVNWRGHNFQVNRQVAPIFVALLDDLYAAGYRPLSIGGHNDRNIAGTNTPSLHSYGLAIDIDPNLNPVQYGGSNRHALPANVAALAAKYGLSWGGSWKSYKDPMHFSVPYGGRE